MTVAHDMVRGTIERLSKTAPASTWAPAVAVVVINVTVALGVSGSAGRVFVIAVLALLCGGSIYVLRQRLVTNRLDVAEEFSAPCRDDKDGRVRRHLAVERVDRTEGESFTEDLYLTVWIGATGGGDRILEARATHHRDAVRYRTLTLVYPYVGLDSEKIPVTPELTVAESDIDALWKPLETAGRGMVVFTPPASGDVVKWQLSYTPDGLWDPLRSVGLDIFRYDVRTFPIGTFGVQFVIDSTARAVLVQERNRRGTALEAQRDQRGNWQVVWTADRPTIEAKYEWDIRVDWPDGPDHPSQ